MPPLSISALERVAAMLEADTIDAAPILDATEDLGSSPSLSVLTTPQ